MLKSASASLAELEYLNYRRALEEGDSRAEIVAFFGPVRTSELEAQFAREFPERVPPMVRAIDNVLHFDFASVLR